MMPAAGAKTIAYVTWITLVIEADSMTWTDQICPPIAPAQDEVVLPDDPSFEAKCRSEVSDSAEKFNWQFRNSILTVSESWGLIWRVDFDTLGTPSRGGSVNRITCWQSLEESGGRVSGTSIAIGKRVSPLSIPRPGSAADAAAAFHALMRSRRSIRKFRAGTISDAVLERLLASAMAAPSAHNRQPWRFVIIEEPLAKVALAGAMGARLAADRRRDGDAAAAIEQDVARSYVRLTGAPILILVNLTLEDADVYPDAARRDAEFLMAVQGTAMAAQNLLLGAHAEGLAACWMCAPLFCPEVVREILGLPAHWQPQGLIALGIAADAGRERPRRPLEEIAVRAHYLAPSRHGGGASRT